MTLQEHGKLLVYLTDSLSCTRRKIGERPQLTVGRNERLETFGSHRCHAIDDLAKNCQRSCGEDSSGRNEDDGRNHRFDGSNRCRVHAITLEVVLGEHHSMGAAGLSSG